MPSTTVLAVVLYCVCSSSMLIINKLAVGHIGAPAFVTFMQFLVTAVVVKVAHLCGLLQVDAFDCTKLLHFSIYVVGFSAGTWTNMKVLMTANVETVIVFRTIAPLAVAFFDYIFHGRDLPSCRSCLAMGIIVAGALSYVLNDKSFAMSGLRAYAWVAVWLAFLVFNLTYGKYLMSGLGVSSWTAVLYNNSLSMVPTLVFGLLGGEMTKLQAIEWTPIGVGWLAASCVVGLGISYAGFKCQSLISATSYTVIGVLNKMFTVLVNTLMWDNHASAAGIASLAACLAGGALYQQAPLREDREPKSPGLGRNSLLSPAPWGAKKPLIVCMAIVMTGMGGYVLLASAPAVAPPSPSPLDLPSVVPSGRRGGLPGAGRMHQSGRMHNHTYYRSAHSAKFGAKASGEAATGVKAEGKARGMPAEGKGKTSASRASKVHARKAPGAW